MNEGLLIRVYNGCNKEPETARRLREKENYIYQSGFGAGLGPVRAPRQRRRGRAGRPHYRRPAPAGKAPARRGRPSPRQSGERLIFSMGKGPALSRGALLV